MSRILRKRALELHNMLGQMYENISVPEPLDQDAVTNAFEQIQSMVIELGSGIEAGYGHADLITDYEAYCENVYQITQHLYDGGLRLLLSEQKKLLEKMNKDLDAVLPDRFEAVFFPYKSAMWDSMESIYLAAEADDETDAFIVPIPYFDRNPDKSFGQMHYEGDEIARNYKVIRYDNYDVEHRMPDFIFIHNPYDDGNYVTSVHPDYYAKRLRNFTLGMVYAPYFVQNGMYRSVNTVQTSGVVYSNYILAQTEMEKADYVKYMKELSEELDISDKIITIGSPQFDKARGIKGSKLNIPESWLPRMDHKKVVLYNTSIGDMLYWDAYLDKLESVFTFFEESEEYTVIWRPHPLLEASFQSMRPGLYKRFLGMKERFLSIGKGIYDEMPDPYYAIKSSDLYYGDASSVIYLCKAAGIPIIRQDFDDLENRELMDEKLSEVDYWYGEDHPLPDNIGLEIWKELKKRVTASEEASL